jgi:hypothetical protein
MIDKFATQDPANPAFCIMPTGVRVTRASATAQGYIVKDANAIGRDIGHTGETLKDFAKSFDRAIELASRSAEQTTYLASVLALPEAKTRPSAAARLGASYNATQMPIDKAQAFLRGLPEESSAPVVTARTAVNDIQDFRRKVELRLAALSLNAKHGNVRANREAMKLSYAMRAFDQGGVTLQNALSASGLDARATVRAVIGI